MLHFSVDCIFYERVIIRNFYDVNFIDLFCACVRACVRARVRVCVCVYGAGHK